MGDCCIYMTIVKIKKGAVVVCVLVSISLC